MHQTTGGTQPPVTLLPTRAIQAMANQSSEDLFSQSHSSLATTLLLVKPSDSVYTATENGFQFPVKPMKE